MRYLPYRDRFAFAKAGEYVPWRTVIAKKATAPIGTLLQIDGLPAAPCLVVNQLQPLLPATTIQVVVPPGTVVNPLDTVPLSQALLFFDARDRDQVAEARKLIDARHGQVKKRQASFAVTEGKTTAKGTSFLYSD